MNISASVFLILIPLQTWAQTPVVNDATGNLIGYPISENFPDGIKLLTPGGIILSLDDGGVPQGTFVPTFSYEDGNCSGPRLVVTDKLDASFTNSIEPEWWQVEGQYPRPLYWYRSGLQSEVLDIASILLVNGGCASVRATQEVVPYDDLKILDPTLLGFELLVAADETQYWGFKPPLNLSLDKPEIISCDGFESCPTQ